MSASNSFVTLTLFLVFFSFNCLFFVALMPDSPLGKLFASLLSGDSERYPKSTIPPVTEVAEDPARELDKDTLVLPLDPVVKPPFELLFDMACPRHKSRVSIVVPLGLMDLGRFLDNMKLWEEDMYFPCDPGTLSSTEHLEPPVDLIFFFKELNPDHAKQAKDTIFHSLPSRIKKCFGDIRFEQITEEESGGTADAPPLLLLALSRRMKQNKYSYIMYMEAEVYPVRNNWAQKVFLESVCGEDFWVKGSVFRKSTEGHVKAYGHHINQNGLHNVGDIKSYLNLQDAWRAHNSEPVDVSMWRHYFLPENVATARDIIHKYRFSNFIQNMHTEPWSASDVHNNYPDTYFVIGSNRQD